MAIKTYENIKRTRSAKILGIDLGKFYMYVSKRFSRKLDYCWAFPVSF
jgi:hypothetical protein